VRGFEDQIGQDAEEVVSRAREVAELVRLLRETSQGLVWVGGTAGIGKSFTLAKALTCVLEAPPPDTLLLPFRFKVGDDRCTRGAFLQFAVERLEARDASAEEVSGRGTDHAEPFDRLRAALNRVPGDKRVVFVLDGLDEIASRDVRFATEVPLALGLPRVAWICAGRKEAGLPEAFRQAGAIEPWPGGLPGMNQADIHEMLLEWACPGSVDRLTLSVLLFSHEQEWGPVEACGERVAFSKDLWETRPVRFPEVRQLPQAVRHAAASAPRGRSVGGRPACSSKSTGET
jgi:hypothetical protein